MDWLTLVSYALAIGSIVGVYHNGSIFADLRARDEAAAGAFSAGHRRHFFAAARNCPFCMSYWCAITLTPLLIVSAALPAPWSRLSLLPIHALAAVRLSWIVDGLLPERLRYGAILQALEKPRVTPESPGWPDDRGAGGSTEIPAAP